MKAIKRNKLARSTIQHFEFADVLTNNITGEKSLHATKIFQPNDIICNFSAVITSHIPTHLTLQVALHQHIVLAPEFLQFTNHSCNPNVFFNTTTYELIALKEIYKGDEITFFYPSTEWNMTQAFVCNCGHKNCLQNIRGAAYLTKESLSNYRLTDFILKMLLQ
ncbi:MAG: SET domain-containing protein-lysine N-methyltransferase [Chitinophagaceae bacterium]|nr:SET domain-containing protein-lysine N-methyltransferase [Chitinophagaceae bacterium]